MRESGDFTADPRMIWISTIALGVGVICAFVALVLMWAIGFFTNLFFYQQFSLTFRSPADNQLGIWRCSSRWSAG